MEIFSYCTEIVPAKKRADSVRMFDNSSGADREFDSGINSRSASIDDKVVVKGIFDECLYSLYIVFILSFWCEDGGKDRRRRRWSKGSTRKRKNGNPTWTLSDNKSSEMVEDAVESEAVPPEKKKLRRTVCKPKNRKMNPTKKKQRTVRRVSTRRKTKRTHVSDKRSGAKRTFEEFDGGSSASECRV